MYKVMLVDDDYPVLEYLSKMIDWSELGLTLQSVHINGMSALIEAETSMPDILITDIGMPKMDGINLTKKLKEKNSSLIVAILSCHNEFEFVQSALKLKVQEYILKDRLDLDQVVQLLRQFKHTLDVEQNNKKSQLQLAHTLERNKAMMIEKLLNKTIYQPLHYEKDWSKEAELFGIKRNQKYIIILCVVDAYQSLLNQFRSKALMNFLFYNVITEMMDKEELKGVYGHFDKENSYLFIPDHDICEEDTYKIKKVIEKIQCIFYETFGISISFIIGKGATLPIEIKNQMIKLMESKVQKFYLKPKSIVNLQELPISQENIFSWYNEASREFKETIVLNNVEMEQKVVMIKKWIQFIIDHQFSPDSVKDWMLKILLDIKVKIQALTNFKLYGVPGNLYDTISQINGIFEMENWLIEFFNKSSNQAIYESISNVEIANACRYISENIHRKITQDEVASYLHLNSSYFSRLFKKEVGENFVKYIVNLKMKRAKELLDQTNYTVIEISELLGYENQSYFNKTFKAFAGIAPIEYRKGDYAK
ncbi:response regulator transcription factor [Bacillus cihuensis]|uniref:response regulator transcription factor n=1 Tax=Bacillus cihuensis TaxID=1208599 RepID=UPI000418389C|nr:helix-turn-helix domain-containing protein [Bacillus cihuensis]